MARQRDGLRLNLSRAGRRQIAGGSSDVISTWG